MTDVSFRSDVASLATEATAFVEDAVSDADAGGVVVGLSGGIDSTVAAHLAVRALGADRVAGYSLPAAASSYKNVEDARTVAERLGIAFESVDVQRPIDAVLETVAADVGDARPDERAVGNVAARLRMTLLYLEANRRDRLVLGTGNRSERLLGYFTKHGDGGVDLLPIGHLYKTEVRRLARQLDVDETLIRKPPTAGLREGQRDEDELGAPYDAIDRVLHRHVDRQQSVDAVADAVELDRETVERIVAMVAAHRHKRRVPPTPETYRASVAAVDGEPDGGSGGQALSDVHMQHIVDLLDRPPSVVGFEARRWTPELIRRYVADAYGTDYPVERIERLLDGLDY